MNKPLVDLIARRVLRGCPDSFYAARLRLTLACSRLARDIDRLIVPKLAWLSDKIHR